MINHEDDGDDDDDDDENDDDDDDDDDDNDDDDVDDATDVQHSINRQEHPGGNSITQCVFYNMGLDQDYYHHHSHHHHKGGRNESPQTKSQTKKQLEQLSLSMHLRKAIQLHSREITFF